MELKSIVWAGRFITWNLLVLLQDVIALLVCSGSLCSEMIISALFPNWHKRTWPLQVFSFMKTDPWHLVWKIHGDTWWYCSEWGWMGGIVFLLPWCWPNWFYTRCREFSFHIKIQVIFFCDDYKIPLKRLLQLHYGPKHTTSDHNHYITSDHNLSNKFKIIEWCNTNNWS